MRREGRVHGMVRTYPVLSSPWNPRANPRNLNVVRSPPTAGLFNKVSTKPTNHSKFTGKCGRVMCRDCHIHPPNGKSKDKSKGSKIRSVSQSGLITGLIAWRVVAKNQGGAEFTGRSATSMLGYLATEDDDDDDDDLLDRDGNGDVEELYDSNIQVSSGMVPEEIDDGEKVITNDANVDDDGDDVGFVLQAVDEPEGWFLVEEDM